MKIERNLGSNFGQQDFQKAPAGQTPASSESSDQLESLAGLQTDGVATSFTDGGKLQNFGSFGGFDLLSGRLTQSFGVAFAAPETQPADDSFSISDVYPLNYVVDAWDWLEGLDLPSVSEAAEWVGDKVVDGFLIAGEAIGDGAKAVWDGFSAAGEAVGDAMASIENAVSDAFDW
jgi:hypothetical protein